MSSNRGSSTGPARGLLFIISAPSGAGKTTLAEQLALQTPRLKLSRSYTSRPARPGEIDGVDYNFVGRERFETMAAAGEFLERDRDRGLSGGDRARASPQRPERGGARRELGEDLRQDQGGAAMTG